MLIQICKLSLAALENTHNSGLLQQLLNEVHKDDVLIQLNAIEMLSDLTMVDHGLVYLDQQGVVGKLESMMGDLDSNPLGNLLLPGMETVRFEIYDNILFYSQKALFYLKRKIQYWFIELLLSRVDEVFRRSCSFSSKGGLQQ